MFRASGTGIPPDTLVVQREHLEAAFRDGPLETDFTFRTRARIPGGTGPYEAPTTWSTDVTWEVLGD